MSRSRELATALNDMFRKEAKYTRDALVPASSLQLEWVTSGSLVLDRALGGGLVRGRSVEYSGAFSTLKSYLAHSALGAAQAIGMNGFYYDPEGSFEPGRAEQLGVDTDSLEMVDRDLRGDQGLDVIEACLRQGNAFCIVDSIAALLPKAEAERRIGDDTVARQAMLMSVAMRKLTQANQNGVLIFINQLRESPNVTFGSPVRTTGGRAIGFYATHRVRFSRLEVETDEVTHLDPKTHKFVTGKRPVAHIIQAKVEKNKAGRPLMEGVFRFDLTTGMIDESFELLNLGLELGLVSQPSATSYSWVSDQGEVVKAQYAKTAMRRLREDPSTLRPLVEAALAAERARGGPSAGSGAIVAPDDAQAGDEANAPQEASAAPSPLKLGPSLLEQAQARLAALDGELG